MITLKTKLTLEELHGVIQDVIPNTYGDIILYAYFPETLFDFITATTEWNTFVKSQLKFMGNLNKIENLEIFGNIIVEVKIKQQLSSILLVGNNNVYELSIS